MPHNLDQPICLEERLQNAKILSMYDVPCPIVVDPMTNETSILYGAQPERLFVLCDGKIAYEGGPGPVMYNMEEVKQWLVQFESKLKKV